MPGADAILGFGNAFRAEPARFQNEGIIGLSYRDNGFKIMSRDLPLNLPDDFPGPKMRVQSSKILVAQLAANKKKKP
jgi:TRAP-type C4-dicarboxylate transport system substrate-binding protein